MIALLTNVVGRIAGVRAVAAAPAHLKSMGSVFAFDALGMPHWSGRDYATLAREGVMRNPIVYRAVRIIAEAVSAVPLRVMNEGRMVASHPLLDLIERPNEGETRVELIEQIVSGLLVSGNAYVQAIPVGGSVGALYVLRPDRVRVVTGADGWPQGFEYQTATGFRALSGEAVPGVARVMHLRLSHPLSDTDGLAPIEAAASSIDLHNSASRWNKALLDNSARPSGALVYTASQQMTPEQFDRLKRELDESFQGARNAGRPMLLEGGLDWKAMSLNPKDMDFIELKNVAAREIALAIGVPPMLLGIPGDTTYSNYREASRTLWQQTVLPLSHRIAGGLARWLSPAFGPALALEPDLEKVDALSGAREALWARLEQSSFLTLNEKRAALGFPPLAGGDAL